MAFAPFPAQVAFFRRKVNVPSARWDDLQRADHAHGFMVAGLARADVLADLRRAIEDAIGRGETLEDFRARFEAIVQGRWEGWTGSGSPRGRAWRTRIIYQTNLRTSYMAGRWEKLRDFPYLKYQHNTVENPRHEHQAWDGLIIATDDPWWDTHYPPNGWGCRCTVTGVSEQRLRAMRGDRGADRPPSDGAGDPPPEWAYHVGHAARSLPAAARFGETLMALPASWREIALADAQRRRVDWFLDWSAEVAAAQRAVASGRPRDDGAATPVGFMREPVVAAMLVGRGMRSRRDGPTPIAFDSVSLRTAMFAVTRGRMIHGLADKKFSDRPHERAAFAHMLDKLPEALSDPSAVVLWHPGQVRGRDKPSLLVARRRQDGLYETYIFRLNHRERGVMAHWLRTIEVYPASVLRQHIVLSGQLE